MKALRNAGGGRRKIWPIVLGYLLGSSMAYPASHYQVLRSFGFANLTAQKPEAPLVEGSDGALYGTSYAGGAGLGTVFKLNKDGTGQTILHQFLGSVSDGQNPASGLLLASNGCFYGTTSQGGRFSQGTIFALQPNGNGYTNLYTFGVTPREATEPMDGLIQGTDGALYGTSTGGGSNNVGTVFKVRLDGTGFTSIHSFAGAGGVVPEGGLIEASDGVLYGTTTGGGSNGGGVVFKLNSDGSGFTTIHNFLAVPADGRAPHSTLVEGADGGLYGVAPTGGSNNLGTVFRLNKDGSGYTNLHHFGGPGDGANPQALTIAQDGALYGATSAGGSNSVGTLFKLALDGSGYTVLRHFGGSSWDSKTPLAQPLAASDGILYGTTYAGGSSGVGTVFAIQKDGSQYGTIVSLSSTAGDASNPQGGLVFGTNGLLFGTTRSGGVFALGTIYSLSSLGQNYSILHSFAGTNGSDGSSPWGPLVVGSDGALYGTTHAGGTNNLGTIFKLNQDGSGYMPLYSFSTNGDASSPAAGLIEGADGFLYGTTFYGGATGNGTVFKCSKDLGTYTIIHSFMGSDGASPEAVVLQGSDGALYGTTYYGGSNNLGVVFRLATDGSTYGVLHYFVPGQVDGASPAAELIEGSDGWLYGTTSTGGTNGGTGTVFKLDKQGNGYTLLQTFPTPWEVEGGLVEGKDGALYGTTYTGGPQGGGILFLLNKDGTGFATLQNLGGVNGARTTARLVRQTSGVFFGTTSMGGQLGSGVVFRLFPPQTPDMLSVMQSGGIPQVTFAGVGGYQYSLWRSVNLTDWNLIISLTMPPSGICTNVDTSSPSPAAFYRAAWMP
jgi:uncharacterized repeat protein (TIGR03803 family)